MKTFQDYVLKGYCGICKVYDIVRRDPVDNKLKCIQHGGYADEKKKIYDYTSVL